jgi:hypothetical protein
MRGFIRPKTPRRRLSGFGQQWRTPIDMVGVCGEDVA